MRSMLMLMFADGTTGVPEAVESFGHALEVSGYRAEVVQTLTGRVVHYGGVVRSGFNALTGGAFTSTVTPAKWSKLLSSKPMSEPFQYPAQPPRETLLVPYQGGGMSAVLALDPSTGRPIICTEPIGGRITGPDPQVRMLYQWAGYRQEAAPLANYPGMAGWSIWGLEQSPAAIIETLLMGGEYTFPPPRAKHEPVVILAIEGPDDPGGYETDLVIQRVIQMALPATVTALSVYPDA